MGKLIEASKAAYQAALNKAGVQREVRTEIRAMSDFPEIFYYAEDYHSNTWRNQELVPIAQHSPSRWRCRLSLSGRLRNCARSFLRDFQRISGSSTARNPIVW